MQWQRLGKKTRYLSFFLIFVLLLNSGCGKPGTTPSSSLTTLYPAPVPFTPLTRVSNNYASMSFNLTNSAVYPDGSAWIQNNLSITPAANTMQVAAGKSFALSLNSLTDLSSNVYTPAVAGDPMVLNVTSSGTTSGAATAKKYMSGSLVSYFSAVATSAYNIRVVQASELVTVPIFPLTTVMIDSPTSHSDDHTHHAASIASVQVDTTAKTLVANGTYYETAGDGAFGNCRYFKNKTVPTTWDDAQDMYILSVNSTTVFNCNSSITRNTSAKTWALNLNINGLNGTNLIVMIGEDCWAASGQYAKHCGFTFFNLSSY